MKAKKFKKLFRARLEEDLENYIKEAEHQEGKAYWKEFDGEPGKVVGDFAMYLVGVHLPTHNLIDVRTLDEFDAEVDMKDVLLDPQKNETTELPNGHEAPKEDADEEDPTEPLKRHFRVKYKWLKGPNPEPSVAIIEAPTASHAKTLFSRNYSSADFHLESIEEIEFGAANVDIKF